MCDKLSIDLYNVYCYTKAMSKNEEGLTEQQYNEFWDKLISGQLPAKIAIPVFLSMADIKPVKGWEKV